MVKGRFSLVPAVYLLFIRDNEILLLLRKGTGYMDGYFSLPAGHIDGNEPALADAIREAKEETGIELNSANLELVHTMHRSVEDHERIDLFFKVNHWKGEPTNMELEKCESLEWHSLDRLPANMIPQVEYAIRKAVAGDIYSDYGFD